MAAKSDGNRVIIGTVPICIIFIFFVHIIL
jgi:hypothetical protein